MKVSRLNKVAIGLWLVLSVALTIALVPLSLLLEIVGGTAGGLYIFGTLFIWYIMLNEGRPLWHIIYFVAALAWPFFLGQRIYWWSKGELTS